LDKLQTYLGDQKAVRKTKVEGHKKRHGELANPGFENLFQGRIGGISHRCESTGRKSIYARSTFTGITEENSGSRRGFKLKSKVVGDIGNNRPEDTN